MTTRKFQIIDCKPIQEEDKKRIKEEVSKLPSPPRFTIVSVGEDYGSTKYMKQKIEHSLDVGIEPKHISLPNSTTEEQLLAILGDIERKSHAIILQLPLNSDNPIDTNKVMDMGIPHYMDVDGLTTYNQGLLYQSSKEGLYPATPSGVIELLEKDLKYPLEGKFALVIGRSNLFGKPMAEMLTQANCTVTLAHSKTPNLQEVIESGQWDIVISAIGKPHAIKNIDSDVIIDVGINFLEGKMVGDIDLSTCSYDCATTCGGGIGGIGRKTITQLLSNVVKAYKMQ